MDFRGSRELLPRGGGGGGHPRDRETINMERMDSREREGRDRGDGRYMAVNRNQKYPPIKQQESIAI